MKKRISVLVLALALIFALIPAAPTAASQFAVPNSIAPANYLGLSHSIGERYLIAVGDTVIESDIYRIEIADDTLYHYGFESTIKDLMALIEKETMMSFFPRGSQWENEKVYIYIGAFLASASAYNVFLNYAQAIDTYESLYVILHELLHVIQMRNVPLVSIIFSEAFAHHTAQHLLKIYRNDPFDQYFGFGEISTVLEEIVFSDRFEEYFYKNEYIYDGSDHSHASVMHQGGLFFGYYLNERYGDNKVYRLLKGFYDEYKAGRLREIDLIQYIKQKTSDSVFSTFVDWYWENKDDYYDDWFFSPSLLNSQYVMPPTIRISFHPGVGHSYFFMLTATPDGVFINLTDARAYARHRGFEQYISIRERKIEILSGEEIVSIIPATCTLAFYNDKGQRIAIGDAQADWSFRYHNQDITGVYIFGDNLTVIFSMGYDPPPPPEAPNVSAASSWARDYINTAFGNGIIPTSLQNNYRNNITRAEFCALAVALIETVTGRAITERQVFADDEGDINIRKIGGLGIVTGTGNNAAGERLFAPNDPIQRQQAALILTRVADHLKKPLPNQAPAFSDNNRMENWARAPIGQMQATGIMTGSGGNFDPRGTYTREQSIITMVRMWNWVKG
jgi:hypothetical protein